MKSKEQLIEELTLNLQVRHTSGYGTWIVSSYYTDEEGDEVELNMTTHNEDNYTGIFDGEEYNGYANSEQCREDYEHEYGDMDEDNDDYMTFDEYYNEIISDSANEDNYEPRDQRDDRLARELFAEYRDEIEYED